MQNSVLDILETIDEVYFSAENSIERYNILHQIEEGIKQMRSISANEIKNEEIATRSDKIEPVLPSNAHAEFLEYLIINEAKLAKINKLVNELTPDDVVLTMSSKVLSIENYRDIDSLTMMEVLVGIEEILEIDLLNTNVHDEMTIGDLIKMRPI